MRVAITMRVVVTAQYKETRDAISHDWLKFFYKCKITPVLIPNLLKDPVSYLKNQKVEALILSGGNDVSLGTNDKKNLSSDISPERDRTEYLLLKYAVEEKVLVLGICRGMQFINTFFNGSLKRLESNGSPFHNHVGCNHEIEITDENFIALIGNRIIINSFHNYVVTPNNLSQELRIFAIHMQEAVCEGLYHPELPIIGLQWHPERKNPSSKEDQALIRNFFKKGAFWREQL